MLDIKPEEDSLDVMESAALLLSRDTAEQILERMEIYNLRLRQLSAKLLVLQKQKWGYDANGNVLAKLHDCGYGCMGCPHLSWYTLRVRRVNDTAKRNYGRRYVTFRRIKHPAKVSRVQQFPELLSLIHSINDTAADRARLVGFLSRLRKHLGLTQPPVLAP